jgi:hypothetical protein
MQDRNLGNRALNFGVAIGGGGTLTTPLCRSSNGEYSKANDGIDSPELAKVMARLASRGESLTDKSFLSNFEPPSRSRFLLFSFFAGGVRDQKKAIAKSAPLSFPR